MNFFIEAAKIAIQEMLHEMQKIIEGKNAEIKKLRKNLGYDQSLGILYEVIEKPDSFLIINSLLGRTSFYSKWRPVVGIKVKKDGHDPEIMYIEVSSIEKAEIGMLIIKGRLLHYLTKCEIYIRYSEASGLLVKGSSYLEIIKE